MQTYPDQRICLASEQLIRFKCSGFSCLFPDKMAGMKLSKFPIAGVKQVIVVASGKGGVGKSATAGKADQSLCTAAFDPVQ